MLYHFGGDRDGGGEVVVVFLREWYVFLAAEDQAVKEV